MIPGAMTNIENLTKTGSAIQKEGTKAQAAWRSHKHTLFFQNKESRLKINFRKRISHE
jgi:hypothetical protein